MCAAGIMKLFANPLPGLAPQRAIATYASMEGQDVHLILKKLKSIQVKGPYAYGRQSTVAVKKTVIRIFRTPY